QLFAKLDREKPSGETPLVRAMMDARVDFAGKRGFKTMLVITDGMDTRFVPGRYPNVRDPSPGDQKYNRDGKQDIKGFLKREFKGSDIDIHMVGFQLGEEEARSEEQFKEAIEELGGKYYK